MTDISPRPPTAPLAGLVRLLTGRRRAAPRREPVAPTPFGALAPAMPEPALLLLPEPAAPTLPASPAEAGGPARAYPALHAPRDGFVFVVTYGRSGSTLTQRLLNALPGWCIRGENANLTYHLAQIAHLAATHEMYAMRRTDAVRPREERHLYTRDLVGEAHDPWWGVEAVDPDDLRLSLMNLFAEKVLRLPSGTRVGGFKEIRQWEDAGFFARHLDVLKESFPNARFLFQKRGHEAVARSQWWRKLDAAVVARRLATADRLFEDYAAANPERSFVIEHERYAEGAPYVREILGFLGEALDDAAIEAVLASRLNH
ncbi:MAG: sulfotransferase [Paracoccaceae bacterium]